MAGDKLIPGWAFLAQSSVLRTRAGQDSWEGYRSSVFQRDQALLAPYSHIKVEHHFAQSVEQVGHSQAELTQAKEVVLEAGSAEGFLAGCSATKEESRKEGWEKGLRVDRE
ncbi:UNVERIFIED_CONTAM: hypothetical protein Sradi_6452100 [Sesamum radiatum]|uniref:Uncharacterized protein n=1 Tax=Sesamum radiatum TaxID=300843 RepID=A0AAW2K5Y9_SESRA